MTKGLRPWVVAMALTAMTVLPVPSWAAGFRDTLAGWAERLDTAAATAEAAPAVPATRVGGGASLKKGMDGDRVVQLTRRLTELGYLAAEQQTGVFDDAADAAVRAFQLSQNLTADGVVGGATRTALNRTPADAARSMRQSAASMRSLLASMPDSVLLVNLPSQMVTLVRDNTEVMTMRSVVGRPSRETPLLKDRITHIIVNPTWTVPPTVLKEDKLPILRARGTPGISNAIVYLDGEPVPPEVVDWTQVTPGRVRIVQQPGDHNALGRFRFNLTNPDNIYLHGTNEPRLFDRDLRTVSSGCVRLQDARALAEVLLAEVNVTPQRIDAILAKGTTEWIKVKPLEVRFVYWTSTVAQDGSIQLHPDVYDMVDDGPQAAARTTAPQTSTTQNGTTQNGTTTKHLAPQRPVTAPASAAAPVPAPAPAPASTPAPVSDTPPSGA